MSSKRMASVVIVLALVSQGIGLRAGGFLETFDITGAGPSPMPGHLLARVIPIRWDTRALPVRYSMNNTLDPIPNPLGAPLLTLAAATAAMQASLDAWNEIPTSYVEMHVANTVGNPGLVGFDFKNEITFRTSASFGAIASSPSVNLIEDVTFVDGDDIDGDGDSDVSGTITTATDVDLDGDIEFPAGLYKAGTILDNDVEFNTKVSNGLRFTVEDVDADTVSRSVDLRGVAVHELGHSIGLSHTLDNQISPTDGTGTSMFPFIDTSDPAAELSLRTLGSDDIAYASYHYPEGTASSGIAALQAGDIAFGSVYGLITGEIRHGVLNQPVAGASVAAYNWETGAFVASAFSGTTNLSFNPATGGLFFVPNVGQAIVNGHYVIPAPKGQYAVGVEATDGSPAAAANISSTTQIGNFFGQMNFHEEFFNAHKEANREIRPGQRKSVVAKAGKTAAGVNITTNNNVNINNFGNLTNIGFINPPTGLFHYAVRVTAAQLLAAVPPDPGTLSLHSILFDTYVIDASVVPHFARAMLARGTVSGSTAAIDLVNPLAQTTGFVGQDADFAPFYLADGHDLAKQVLQEIAAGTLTDLFLVLVIPPGPFPGVSNQPPLIGISSMAPLGFSFLSTDGGATFNRRTDFGFRFSLGMTLVP